MDHAENWLLSTSPANRAITLAGPTTQYSSTHIDVELPHLHRPHFRHHPDHKTKIEVGVPNQRRQYYPDSKVEVEGSRFRPSQHATPVDIIESEYRARTQPKYREEYRATEITVDQSRASVETPLKVNIAQPEPTVEPPRSISTRYTKTSKMAPAEPAYTNNTVTIPCHHIRMGDLLILQGRPCQVIKISTSAATGQHRYLGVDLFTKQLHEESSFISNPAPSVIVQTMLGPVFKQYRVLDMQDGHVVAMTETGDVKQSLPVIDQSNLWKRLSESFETGRGSVRVLVISDNGKELAVDMRTIHGSSL
ncbi:MAG: hypothetical protein M1818_007402 [Claussenomyces sp. TS43310]|nr:MAG: hypothetical protein M1818_007402 [Claussenomyces sp. TS43310]